MPSVLSRVACGWGAALGRSLSTSARAKGGHAPNYEFRYDRLQTRRYADHLHFYAMGLGLIPWGLLAFAQAVLKGECRLEPLPEDRVPRFWEYENTPMKQWRMQFLMNPVKLHEVHLGQYYWHDIKTNIRKRIIRMEHLVGQRQDYEAWFHEPIKARWLEITDYLTEEDTENYAVFQHYFGSSAASGENSGQY